MGLGEEMAARSRRRSKCQERSATSFGVSRKSSELHQTVATSPSSAALTSLEYIQLSYLMSRNIRPITGRTLNNPNICLSCRWRLSTHVAQRPGAQQKRWISRVHIGRIKQAMEDWDQRGKAVREGEKQSMLSVLEERGFVNQIVGSVERHCACIGGRLTQVQYTRRS